MQKVLMFFLIFFSLFSCSHLNKEEAKKPHLLAKVIEILDGDTINVEIEKDYLNENFSNSIYSIRLLYIDSPEVEENERFERFVSKLYKKGNYLKRNEILKLGEYSYSNLSALLRKNDTVKIFYYQKNLFDKYGRILGIVYINGTNVNLYQLTTGYAMAYFYEIKPLNKYKNAEKIAKKQKLGIWKFIDKL